MLYLGIGIGAVFVYIIGFIFYIWGNDFRSDNVNKSLAMYFYMPLFAPVALVVSIMEFFTDMRNFKAIRFLRKRGISYRGNIGSLRNKLSDEEKKIFVDLLKCDDKTKERWRKVLSIR